MSLIAGILAAWLLADFISGVFHWIEDRYLREDWILIGEYIAKPNAIHHSHPQAFLVGGYWYRNWTTIVPALCVLLIAFLCHAPWWVLLGLLFVTQANEVHAFEHRSGKLPRLIELLQETGMLQSVRHHAGHHKSPHRVRYCTMSNWLNPWLDELGFWSAVEKVLFFIPPKPDTGT